MGLTGLRYGDQQLYRVWCDTHQRHEWHWLPLAEAGGG
jgi:hypothetical protein